MSKISQETSDIEILAPNNEKVRLGDLWSKSPVLIVLVRHFGCQFCREQIHDLRNAWKKILSLGVTPIVIGNGTALMAQDFVEETGLTVSLYTNPERNVYDAL
ncbi:MAG: redoxin domain-containing protein, partial [Dehalococcoidia bacterium]|nr:redoxin domain-containing protein [Dehalococcoidia bacterium]